MRFVCLRVAAVLAVLAVLAVQPGCVEKHPDYLGAVGTGGSSGPGSTTGSGAGDGATTVTGSDGTDGTDDGTVPTTSGLTGSSTPGDTATGTTTSVPTTTGETDEEVIPVEADTEVDNSVRDTNFGGADVGSVAGTPRQRTMLRFNRDVMRAAAMNRPLVSARLSVHVVANDGQWGILRPIDLHRMLQDWGESDATWNCAFDSDPGNGTQDCTGNDVWDMDTFGPLSIEVLDSVMVSNATIDTVLHFDVTEEVDDVLAGNLPNFGFLLKKENENVAGSLDVATQEHADPALHPTLTLRLAL